MVAAAEISQEKIECSRPDPNERFLNNDDKNVANLFGSAKMCPGEGRIKSVKALFNSIPIHALPVSVNIMNNALLKYHNIADKSITVTNHPFERYCLKLVF